MLNITELKMKKNKYFKEKMNNQLICGIKILKILNNLIKKILLLNKFHNKKFK